jgi:D,D-heptose 1,7-bisphosphate phosphatase
VTERAAFLDRDGTIVADTGFLRDPTAVRLVDGAAQGIRRLREAGFRVVVVTNQSGIARGLITPTEYQNVASRIDELLAERQAPVDATYFCPHYPEISGPCDCRKPGLGHYRDAGRRFDLDLARSTWIGDRITDLEPAAALGGSGILVVTGEGACHRAAAERAGFAIAADLGAAAELVVGGGDRR